jgi:hypothetical protein
LPIDMLKTDVSEVVGLFAGVMRIVQTPNLGAVFRLDNPEVYTSKLIRETMHSHYKCN